MFSLAHALLMGSSGEGLFTWTNRTSVYVGSYDNYVPQLSVELFPNGLSEIVEDQDSGSDITYEGTWLTVPQPNFGDSVEVRATEIDSAGYFPAWQTTPLDEWVSLNIARKWNTSLSGPIGSSFTSTLQFDFRIATAPGTIVFSATFEASLARLS